MKKFLAIVLAVLMTVTVLGGVAEDTYPQLTGEVGLYKAGVYEQKLRGMGGYMVIHVTFSADKIENMEVISHTETPNIGTVAIEKIIPAMLEAQSADVDAMTGATITSNALKDALAAAIKDAEVAIYVPGTYEVKLRGMGGYMVIQVTFSAAKIENFEVISHTETPNIGTVAIEKIIPAMLEAQSADVDALTGATVTSNALKDAMKQAIDMAKIPAALYTPGTYEVKLRGMGGYMTVQFVFTEDKIESIEVLSHTETPNIGTVAIEKIIPAILEAQSADVDALTGATVTSNALMDATRQAIKLAQGN